jgi:hypothetical protein
MLLQDLTESSFSHLLGTTCRLVVADEAPSVELEIAEVNRAGQAHGGQRTSFSVIFLGPSGRHLPQGIYRLEHEKLGRLDLFLVPIGPEPSGRHRYEAIFT